MKNDIIETESWTEFWLPYLLGVAGSLVVGFLFGMVFWDVYGSGL